MKKIEEYMPHKDEVPVQFKLVREKHRALMDELESKNWKLKDFMAALVDKYFDDKKRK